MYNSLYSGILSGINFEIPVKESQEILPQLPLGISSKMSTGIYGLLRIIIYPVMLQELFHILSQKFQQKPLQFFNIFLYEYIPTKCCSVPLGILSTIPL